MLRRQLKNLVQNYSEAEVKVREATSNDPWGPSSSQMADISDLTYNVVACNEIMTMLWKRLKDDKNWRHIHKSLTLLEYLLKTGDDRVLLKMKENIYIVKALTEYRFVEKDGKDQGVNVREKAKVVLVLMEDDEKLKEERDFAIKTREKTSKGSAASSSDITKDSSYKPCYVPGATGLPSLDNIPSVADLTASFTARKEERLRQEAEKKEAERRAKMSEEELKWEDAGKGRDIKGDKAEKVVKPDPWGAPKEPIEATDPWGTPTRPETTDTAASSDPWVAPAKTDEDPFTATTMDDDPFAAPKNGEDFAAPKAKHDPFSASKDDPFSALKDSSDPFSAPEDKDDPFAAPKDKPDPFGSSNNDQFNTPKDDPFSSSKEDPFNALKNDPFNNLKDDPFNTPKDDPFSTPKNDPFTAPVSTPPKEDPFAVPASSKNDPFTAPTTPPKEDPFSAKAKCTSDDPFAAPTTPPKGDPFSATSRPPKDDPFTAPTTHPKDDPFAVSSSPPKDDSSDPFGVRPLNSPQGSGDAWGVLASCPPATGSHPWGTSSAPKETKGGGPWEDVASGSSPIDSSDPFGHASKPDNDPWGAPAPVSADDAWGSPAPPSDSSPSSNPFGDGASHTSDPWGASSNGTGEQTTQKEEMYKKTASFLGSAGASLVDLDHLFSSHPKSKHRPLTNTLAAQTQAIGTFKARGVTSALHGSPFGSTFAPFHDASSPTFGAAYPHSGTPLFQLPSQTMGGSHSCFNMFQAAQVAPPCSGAGMVQPISVGGSPQMGPNMNPPCGGVGAVQSGSLMGNPMADPLLLGTGMGQSSFFGGSQRIGVAHLAGSTSELGGGVLTQPQLLSGSGLAKTVNKNNNPFLF